MVPVGLFVIAGFSSVLTLLWIFFLVRGSKEFDPILEPLPGKDYPVKELYVIGFSILKTINYRYGSKKDKQRLKDVANVYGQRYAEYYLRVVYGQKLTFALTTLLIASYLTVLSMNMPIMFFGVFFSVCVYIYFDLQVKDKIEAKEEELLRDFPEVLSKLTLLINAGMIMKEAWEKVSFTGEGRMYTEMRLTNDEISNGVAEADAYVNFGIRCGVNEIKKFTSTLVQNLTKGNNELIEYLKQQSKESWESKKHSVRRQGEKASSKLMIPIGIMFVGIMIILIVPIFGNIMSG